MRPTAMQVESQNSKDVGETHSQRQNRSPKTIIACLRCRNQKLKCDRELPSCARCQKQKARCNYPSPPDRRRIALKTRQTKAAGILAVSACAGQGQWLDSFAPVQPREGEQRSAPSEEQTSDGAALNPRAGSNVQPTKPGSRDLENAELPPTEVGLLLLEVYFKRVYNASLLFHKPIAFHLYRQNDIPEYLLRAIFAQAAVFLQQVDPQLKKFIGDFTFHTIFEKSSSWAHLASREVLSHVDEPTLVRIQTLQVLHVYYFSQGEMQKSTIHASLAYQLCQVLGYDRLSNNTFLGLTSHGLQLDQEIKRRCFWASWANLRMVGHKFDHVQTMKELGHLPLPLRFERSGSVQGIELKLGQKRDLDWEPSISLSPGPKLVSTPSYSLMAKFIQLVDAWSDVKAYMNECPWQSHPQRNIRLGELMKPFDLLKNSLDILPSEIHSQVESYDENPELLTSLCCMYHLGRLLLHVSVVPGLSSSTSGPTNSTETIQRHHEEALKQATMILNILQQYVAKECDVTRLWHFSGHGAFIAGTIFAVHHRTSVNQQVKVPGLDFEELKVALVVLEVLSAYWKPLRKLTTILRETIKTGECVTSLVSIDLFGDVDVQRPIFSDYDDTISILNSLNTVMPLFRAAPGDSLSSHEQLRHTSRHSEPATSHQTPFEQRTPSPRVEVISDRVLSRFSDFGIERQQHPSTSSQNEGDFDTDWEHAFSTNNSWSTTIPFSFEDLPEDDVSFF